MKCRANTFNGCQRHKTALCIQKGPSLLTIYLNETQPLPDHHCCHGGDGLLQRINHKILHLLSYLSINKNTKEGQNILCNRDEEECRHYYPHLSCYISTLKICQPFLCLLPKNDKIKKIQHKFVMISLKVKKKGWFYYFLVISSYPQNRTNYDY